MKTWIILITLAVVFGVGFLLFLLSAFFLRKKQPLFYVLREFLDSGRINQIISRSQEFDYSPFEKRVDFIFVDGDHTYNGIKNDSQAALRMLAPGGIILWHDYFPRFSEVRRYLHELNENLQLRHVPDTALIMYQAPRAESSKKVEISKK